MMTFCCCVIHSAAGRLHILLHHHSSTGKPQRASEVVCRQVKSLQVEAKVTFVHVFCLFLIAFARLSSCFHSVMLFQSVSEPAGSHAFSPLTLTRVYFTFLLITTCFQPDFLSSEWPVHISPPGQILQRRSCSPRHVGTELMFIFCSVFLCSEEYNQRQSGASGVLLERLLVREVSQEKKERAGPETPPGAE